MATEVRIPQLGESVTEGTITNWLVEIGERVEADQPLFELSSDKIDTEVPSPAGGVLTEIKVGVDETVDVGTVVAVIADEGEAGDQLASRQAEQAPTESEGTVAATASEPQSQAAAETQEQQRAEQPPGPFDEAQAPARPAEEAPFPGRADADGAQQVPAQPAARGGDGGAAGKLMSPLVRRMAAEHNVDVSSISPTGEGGRITREDVEAAIARGGAQAPQAAPQAPTERPQAPAGRAAAQPTRAPGGERERVEDLSRIRQRIAAKMVESLQSAAQLTTVQEADVTGVMLLRDRYKDAFKAREGVSLSPFVFMARAAVLALRRHPFVNAQADWNAGKVKFHDYVNLGIAVDTEKGLIVPNVKGADDLTLAALARAIKDAADKARGARKLEMQDIEGGTFTVTNTGSRGVLIDTPILNYPEVAILGTGAIKQRPVVVDSELGPTIAIRHMVYLCLTYDHRLLDGADAARYVTDVKYVLETHDWAAEIGYEDGGDGE